jgi:hypothetical protein
MAVSCRSADHRRYGLLVPFGGATGELASRVVHMSPAIPVAESTTFGQRVHDRKRVRFSSRFPRDCPPFSPA